MFPPAIRAEMGRVIIDQFNIGYEAGTPIRAFDQVVTEERILREPSLNRIPQCIYIVDAFSSEDPFTEECRVNNRYSACIDVEAGLAGVDTCETAARCRVDADTDTRLQDAISGNHHLRYGVDHSLMERVGNRAD